MAFRTVISKYSNFKPRQRVLAVELERENLNNGFLKRDYSRRWDGPYHPKLGLPSRSYRHLSRSEQNRLHRQHTSPVNVASDRVSHRHPAQTLTQKNLTRPPHPHPTTTITFPRHLPRDRRQDVRYLTVEYDTRNITGELYDHVSVDGYEMAREKPFSDRSIPNVAHMSVGSGLTFEESVYGVDFGQRVIGVMRGIPLKSDVGARDPERVWHRMES